MSITLRQGQILEKITREYIRLARPVSSQLLEEKYKLGICPATIRIEMQRLTDEGYLYQPHTSAGRVPTDKGYRFFVDNLLKKEIADILDSFEFKEEFKEERKDVFSFVRRLTKFLADVSANLVVARISRKDFIFKEGWEGILKAPEFENRDYVLNFTRFLEDFEKEIDIFEKSGLEKKNVRVKIYIGRENPLKKGRDFSTILASCCFPKKEQGMISILGPKRMAYEKNINLVNSLVKLLEEF